MRNAIKKILPQSAINTLRLISDKKDLSIQNNNLNFSLDNLAVISEQQIASIWSDKKITDQWKKDKKSLDEVFGDDDKFQGVNPGDRRALYALVLGLKPQNILEVGTHVGSSTLHIATALKTLGQGGHVTSVDILDVNAPDSSWKRIGLEKSPIEFAEELSCEELITFIAQPCQEFMKQTDERFDLIFLDGDHTAAAVYQEVSVALNVLNDNGVIVLHDYYPEGKSLYSDNNIIYGPYLALERIKKENTNISVQSLSPLPWETKLQSNMTSLAIVTKKA